VKEAVIVKKKKKRAKKARRKHRKEMEIARWVWAGENRSDMEAELESEDSTEVGVDTSSSEDEGSRSIVATLVEQREPAATSASGGRDAGRRGNVPPLRKCAASSNAAGEQAVKRRRSSWPLEVSPVSPPCSERGGARRSVKGAGSHPRIFRADACTRPTMGGRLASCSGGRVTS